MLERIFVSFDAVADTYDEIRAIPDRVLSKFYETILMKEMRFKRDLVVLDDGIGTGRTVGPLLGLGVELVGVDISRKMLGKAAEKAKRKAVKTQVSLVRGDVTNLPFRPHSFDMVVSVHVLWLLKKWKQAILEARRVLKAKGCFIAANHNSPEFETEVGRKYLEVEQNAFGQSRLAKRIPILNNTSFGREILENKTTQLLILIFDKIAKYYSLESFLARKARLLHKYAIAWEETHNVSAIVSLLDGRLLSLRWSVSAEAFEKLKLDLANWRNKKMKDSPYLEIGLEFVFTVVTFS